jgi:type VI secretion system protein VasG
VLVDPKFLVRRLTRTASRLLEAAVAQAAERRYYEIVVEHLLLEMLKVEDGDSARILHQIGVDRLALMSRVEQDLSAMRTGNAGRPVFSESLFQWIEDAWVVASAETGATVLRSGMLLAQLIARPGKYTSEAYPEFDKVSREQLKREFEDTLAPSPETSEVTTQSSTPARSPGGAPSGADSALAKYSINFTQKAREGWIDPIFGRHREIRQMIDILCRRRKNNPIIVGEPGVGKTALVEGLARAIVAGEVPDSLKNVEIHGLDLGMLQAGAGVRGEFENRLKQVIAETKSSPRPVILFIDEAHTMIGAGNAQGGGDAANLLKPELSRGELRTIAATTWSEYKKYFEKDAALERRFQPVKVDEPSEEDAVAMMRGLAATYEKAHGVTVRDEALISAVKLSHRYLSGRQLPDKAVDVLDTAATRVKMELATRPEALVQIEAEAAADKRERDSVARDVAQGLAQDDGTLAKLDAELRAKADRQATLHARWESERAAADKVRAAEKALSTAPAGGDTTALKSAVDAARADLAKLQGEEPLVHADVDTDAVAQVIAAWTGVPVRKMRSGELQNVLNLEAKLTERVRGQPHAIKTVAEVVRMAYSGIRNPETPLGVLLFVGPSGVGKTETALALADHLYGGERFITTINMSEFQEKHTVSRLVGSPPGYVGYGEGGVLTEAVRQRPYSVVLLDECEKADLEVMNLFYQVFDKGILNDGEGRAIDFRNTVIILTSNLATDLIVAAHAISDGAEPPKAEDVVAAIRPALSRHFKPALLARMTVVPYAPVGVSVMREIVLMKLNSLAKRLRAAHRLETTFRPAMVDDLAQRCTESELGARIVDQTLRSSLMPELAKELLQRMASGDAFGSLSIGLAEGAAPGTQGGWVFDFNARDGAAAKVAVATAEA